jgi:hypothetical protein
MHIHSRRQRCYGNEIQCCKVNSCWLLIIQASTFTLRVRIWANRENTVTFLNTQSVQFYISQYLDIRIDMVLSRNSPYIWEL